MRIESKILTAKIKAKPKAKAASLDEQINKAKEKLDALLAKKAKK